MFFLVPKDSFVYPFFRNVAVAVDQLFNALLFGDPDETISSRAYKGKLMGNRWWGLLSDFLDFLDKDHGKKTVEWDEGRRK
jgi:hypothetical protein